MGAVLVAIAIPVFTKRLENSRETTDIANMRAAYAAGQVAALAGDFTDGTYGFDPNDPSGLKSGAGTGSVVGKGTAVEGGVSLAGIPAVISEHYTETTPASGHTLDVVLKSGSVFAIQWNGVA